MYSRGIRGESRDFERRALWYWRLDQELRAKTRFFGAAALTNRVLARCFGRHSNAMSHGSGGLLMQLVSALEQFNAGLADHVRLNAAAGPNLDRQLVQAEQGAAQMAWHAQSPDGQRIMVERELNGLLNASHASCFLARLWKDSRDYCNVLATLRARTRAPLNFAVESHRVSIGCALIEHLHLEKCAVSDMAAT